jgi:hypothetical protein
LTGTKTSLSDIVNIVYVNTENSVFEPKNNFLTLKIKIQNEEGLTEEKEYDRVFLHRAFPFEDKFEYISVDDKDGKEIALIKSLEDLNENQRKYITDELDRKYYLPTIIKILSMKERFGFSYWKVLTDTGERTFTMQDTYRSIHKIDTVHIFLTDVDGNRYDIPDIEALDHKSYKKIELYI